MFRGVSPEGAETTPIRRKGAASLQLHVRQDVTVSPFKVEREDLNKKLGSRLQLRADVSLSINLLG